MKSSYTIWQIKYIVHYIDFLSSTHKSSKNFKIILESDLRLSCWVFWVPIFVHLHSSQVFIHIYVNPYVYSFRFEINFVLLCFPDQGSNCFTIRVCRFLFLQHSWCAFDQLVLKILALIVSHLYFSLIWIWCDYFL